MINTDKEFFTRNDIISNFIGDCAYTTCSIYKSWNPRLHDAIFIFFAIYVYVHCTCSVTIL